MLFNLFLVYGYKGTHFFRISQEMLRKSTLKEENLFIFQKNPKGKLQIVTKKRFSCLKRQANRFLIYYI